MIRKGQRNGSTYWYCNDCKRYSSGRKKPSQEAIFNRYSQGTFTIKQLSEEFGISPSSVKRKLKDYPPKKIEHSPRKVVVQMDTTYWGRNFGLVLFMDAESHQILHHFFIYGKERNQDYNQGLEHLKSLGFDIVGVVADGLKGLRNSILEVPYQYCQFHQKQRIRQLLTLNPRMQAAQELQQIVAQLTQSNRVVFSRLLEDWKELWHDFLSEKTYDENGVNFCYTHRKLRAAYRSLKEHLDVLFTYQDFPSGTMPNTNNALESFNSWLKKKLQLHSGISHNRREKLISNLIMAYKPRSRKGS